jgi:hypothetical protein
LTLLQVLCDKSLLEVDRHENLSGKMAAVIPNVLILCERKPLASRLRSSSWHPTSFPRRILQREKRRPHIIGIAVGGEWRDQRVPR